ncbi:hypothetical protein V5O48_018449, partial [Marasmius crinis-equi]
EPENEQGENSTSIEPAAVENKTLIKPKKGRASEPRECSSDFAAEFSEEFFRKRLLGVGHKAVTKAEIAAALQYRSSWLKEAIRGHSLVEAYQGDQRVKSELEFKSPTGKIKGSARLLKFLVDHNAEVSKKST